MWEAFTFKYSCHMNNKDLEAVPSFYRFDCDFIVEDHQVKILRMDGYMAVNWLPWKCRLEKNIVERQCLMWDDLKEIMGKNLYKSSSWFPERHIPGNPGKEMPLHLSPFRWLR